jgi:hypothetical protein
MEEWESIGIHEFLDADPRPSFVIDLGTSVNHPPSICFRNQFVTSNYGFEDPVAWKNPSERTEFQNWAFYPSTRIWSASFSYSGQIWVANTLRGRWRIIQAATIAPYPPEEKFTKLPPGVREGHFGRLESWVKTSRHHDWTSKIPPPNPSQYVQFLRKIDWANTLLGPIESWSPLLRFMTNFVVADPYPVSQPSPAYSVSLQC